mmetsp:Transcript_134411/g.287551  ORF Transcript_134411/g.287551 Transcript_134411/m.287551 type:complete len:209 (+) Transcript_134411:347-973(+)
MAKSFCSMLSWSVFTAGWFFQKSSPSNLPDAASPSPAGTATAEASPFASATAGARVPEARRFGFGAAAASAPMAPFSVVSGAGASVPGDALSDAIFEPSPTFRLKAPLNLLTILVGSTGAGLSLLCNFATMPSSRASLTSERCILGLRSGCSSSDFSASSILIAGLACVAFLLPSRFLLNSSISSSCVRINCSSSLHSSSNSSGSWPS